MLNVVRVSDRYIGERPLRPVHGPLAMVRHIMRVAVEWRVLVIHGDVLRVVVAVTVKTRHPADGGELPAHVPGFEVAVADTVVIGGHAAEGRQSAQSPAERVRAS